MLVSRPVPASLHDRPRIQPRLDHTSKNSHASDCPAVPATMLVQCVPGRSHKGSCAVYDARQSGLADGRAIARSPRSVADRQASVSGAARQCAMRLPPAIRSSLTTGFDNAPDREARMIVRIQAAKIPVVQAEPPPHSQAAPPAGQQGRHRLHKIPCCAAHPKQANHHQAAQAGCIPTLPSSHIQCQIRV